MELKELKDEYAERSVLKICLENPGEYWRVCDEITPDCYTDPANRTIWETMQSLRKSGQPVNIASVAARLTQQETLRAKVFSLLDEYTGLYLNGADTTIIEMRDRRMLLAAIERAKASLFDGFAGSDETIVGLRKDIEAVERGQQTSDTETIGEVLERVRSSCFDRMAGGKRTGSPTGFASIDVSGGLLPGELNIVAGETSQGKTSLAMSIAANAATGGDPVAVYTLEMSKEQLAARILTGYAGVDGRELLQGLPSDEQYNDISEGVERIKGMPILFEKRQPLSVHKICASIRKMVGRHGIKGAVIDYLQLVRQGGRTETEELRVGGIAREFKNLAVELGIWIVLLSQLARDRMNSFPTVNRLRASGQIAEAADCVFLVYRPQYYNETEGKSLSYPDPYRNVETKGTAMVIQAKGRSRGVCTFIATFDPSRTLFSDLPQKALPRRSVSNTPPDDEPPF